MFCVNINTVVYFAVMSLCGYCNVTAVHPAEDVHCGGDLGYPRRGTECGGRLLRSGLPAL